jgi:hypothetical protein
MLARHFAIALPAILAAALGTRAAHADVYTWTDRSGRVNVSNIAPPEGVRVDRVVHVDPPKITPDALAARDAAHAAEVQALNERVAQLQDEVERTRTQVPPPVPYRVVAPPPPPPVQVVVNVAPPQPYPPPVAAVAPDCDPLMFGCPPFVAPVGVVVLRDPRFHRSHRFHRFDHSRASQRMRGARPLPPARHSRRR